MAKERRKMDKEDRERWWEKRKGYSRGPPIGGGAPGKPGGANPAKQEQHTVKCQYKNTIPTAC